MSFKIHTQARKIIFARRMRQCPTESEQILWERIRNNQLGKNYRFIRQEPILGYIADFWCARTNTVIEIDGGYHADRQEYDARRDAAMHAKGITVLRFTNDRIFQELSDVLREIQEALDTAKVDSCSRRIIKGELIIENGSPVWDKEHSAIRTGREYQAA